MKAYTTKHILSIIGLTLLIGIPFGFLYGWQFCLLIACAVLCYSLAVFFKNPTHPVLCSAIRIGWTQRLYGKTLVATCFWLLVLQ